MRKIILVATVSLSALFAVPSTAMPITPLGSGAISGSDLIEVKGGHGHGHGWGRGHGHRHYGWSSGQKVGWRGHHCPPGHWKKGWC
jgi:hypothetical protein